jgi:hypothetical protein
MNRWYGSLVGLGMLVLAAVAVAQPAGDRTAVPFSDPSRPGRVHVSLLSGGITVIGYPGKEVLVTSKPGDGREELDHEEEEEEIDARATGLRRVPNLSSGIVIEEANNIVSVESRSFTHGFDVEIQVPASTSLELQTVNGGDIVVRNVEGEISVENTNGNVVLRDVSGSVVAHALNGNVDVSLQRVDPKKEMSFTSLNGDLDVTLPADLRADLRVKSDNGEIFTDFDIKLTARSEPREAEAHSKDGKSHGRSSRHNYGFENVMAGTLNGGGPTLRFQTFNGNIYIRKAK